MQIQKRITADKLVAFSQEHLYYEFAMLFGVVDILQKEVEDVYLYNALLESFVVHAANILDFFYKPMIKEDDAKAEHFMDHPQAWRKILPPYEKHFKKFDMKRNKRVVHLSYKRLEIHAEDRRWGVRKIAKEIKKLLKLFVKNANPQHLHPRIIELVN